MKQNTKALFVCFFALMVFSAAAAPAQVEQGFTFAGLLQSVLDVVAMGVSAITTYVIAPIL